MQSGIIYDPEVLIIQGFTLSKVNQIYAYSVNRDRWQRPRFSVGYKMYYNYHNCFYMPGSHVVS